MSEHHKVSEYAALMATRTASGRTLGEIAQAAVRKAAKPISAQPKATRAGWNKYGAKKVTTEDGVFDSQIEYKRWLELKQLQAAGVIVNLARQIPFVLEVNGMKICRFTVDHKWQDVASGQWHYEDVKGVLVRDFMLRVKLIKALHGIDVEVWPKRNKVKRKQRKVAKR